jgi:hypothetical protein
MRKTVVMLAILVLVLSFNLFTFVDADSAITLHVDNPVSGETYSTQELSIKYSIDWGFSAYIKNFDVKCYLDTHIYSLTATTGEIVVSNLTAGEHLVRIAGSISLGYMYYGIDVNENVDSGPITFTTKNDVAPKINVSSLEEYTSKTATFNVTTDRSDAKISYILDNSEKTNISQNQSKKILDGYLYKIAANLTDGNHQLTVFATDNLGNTASTQKTFTIKTANLTTDNPEPSATLMKAIVITAIIGTTLAGALILIMYKKTRKNNSTKNPTTLTA